MDMMMDHCLVVGAEGIRHKAPDATVVPMEELCSAEEGTAVLTVVQIHMAVHEEVEEEEDEGANEADDENEDSGKSRDTEDIPVARLEEERPEEDDLSWDHQGHQYPAHTDTVAWDMMPYNKGSKGTMEGIHMVLKMNLMRQE